VARLTKFFFGRMAQRATMSKDNREQLGSSTDLKLKHAYHSNGVVLHGLGTQVRISSHLPANPPS
jgi:hypothetical protein